MLTHERLIEAFLYNPVTGEFTRRSKRYSKPRLSDPDGYVRISLDGKTYKAHRLAWFYMTGEWPTGLVDHRDTDRSNNAWANLRCATRKQNLANASKRRDNTSGVRGVHWHSRDRVWLASIRVDGKLKHLGSFHNLEAARAARVRAAAEHFGEFARH